MKTLFTGIFAFGAVFAPSATAITPAGPFEGETIMPVAVDTTAEQGFRIRKHDEFQVVEHGYWSSQDGPPLPQITSAMGAYSVHRENIQKKSTKSQSNLRRLAFLNDVHAAEVRFGLPHGLLDALIWAESRYNPTAVSSAGAAGLGQLMPGTARDLGVRNRFDPQANISGAAQYLRQMLDRFGVVHLAVAAYNAGPGAVARLGRIPLNGETPRYVRNVLDRWTSN